VIIADSFDRPCRGKQREKIAVRKSHHGTGRESSLRKKKEKKWGQRSLKKTAREGKTLLRTGEGVFRFAPDRINRSRRIC